MAGSKKLAVLVIHGMGKQEQAVPDPTTGLRFSGELYHRLQQVMGSHVLSHDISWAEVTWAKVFGDRETKYLNELKKILPSWGASWMFRTFVMERLADASAYYPTPKGVMTSTYEQVHQEIDKVMEALERDVTSDAPLVILAHSLGGHVMSNYIYDVVQTSPANRRERPSEFQQFQRFGTFITFGCNIPVFTFSHDTIVPIAYPVRGATPPRPWWRNYYSRFDPLGYPLEPVPAYCGLVKSGEIFEERLDVGLFSKYLPTSHNAYWGSPAFARRVADVLNSHM